MENINNILKIAKCYKLQFDTLGYAVVDGKVSNDRNIYRSYLRSGKTKNMVKNTSDREYQIIDVYKRYFAPTNGTKHNPSNRQMIYYALTGDFGFVPKKHYKAIVGITKNLLKRNYLVLTILPDGKLLEDKHNKLKFYYSNKENRIFRLINGKCLPYNL